ncbi:DUF4153 domain-containing protein [Flavobacterium sp. RSSA_27]|uniref:DUF4153 domain-containing protein n=1 Tax=Flavobacterium sp. RSSA_27 TaxID=3447667 RepID=UPI003F315524
MANFPSLQNVFTATRNTIQRFPLETIATLAGSVFAIFLVSKEYGDPNTAFYTKAILSSLLCLVAFLSVSLYFSASRKGYMYRLLASFILGGLAIAFVYSFEDDISEVEAQQFVVLSIALHLLVAFAGFIPKKYHQEEFWEFNKQLFLRIITAGLYSNVLYAGLALAIVAVKELFDLELNEKIFGYLFIAIAGPFNTLFFLNGVPEIQNSKNTLALSYPVGLKKFTQYVLLPLISLYLIILLCYEAKIIFTLSLPIGWVSYLVLVFAIIGILSFLLVQPIATSAGNLWMQTFNRWFYYLLIPLLGLLFWAILYRIYSYGFTHERYYVLLLAVWLTLLVLYFLGSKNPKIKFIPMSLCFAGLFSLVGPQSAHNISKWSQMNRLTSYVQKLKTQKLTTAEEKNMSSIVDFILTNYAAEIVLPVAKDQLTALYSSQKKPTSTEILKALGVQYHMWNDNSSNYFNYAYPDSDSKYIDNIQGYDISMVVTQDAVINCKNCLNLNAKNYSFLTEKKDYGIDLTINNETIALLLNDFVNNQKQFDNTIEKQKKITQTIDSKNYQITIIYLEIDGKISDNKKTINNFRIKLLIKIK